MIIGCGCSFAAYEDCLCRSKEFIERAVFVTLLLIMGAEGRHAN
jgi:hypothetical protein